MPLRGLPDRTQPDEGSGPAGPRRFSSTQHLAFEAVVAYVDGELRMNAHMRAATHIAECPLCAAEVDAQRQARTMLRESGEISVPRHLLGALSQIPSAFDAPEFPTYQPFEEPGARRAEAGKRGRRRSRG
ncbi:anti-sigma factor family protein [Tsukamurella soli]